MMNFILALSTSLFPITVLAAPGTQEPAHANYRNHLDMTGLCTESQGNKELHYMKSGHCQTIFETLTNSPCVSEKIEQIRLRYLGDEAKMAKAKLKNKESLSIGNGLACDGKNDPTNQNLSKIAEDPHRFRIYLMQLFAMIAIEESNWRVNEGGDNGNGQEVKCDNHCGLLGLNKADMENEKYSCGCKIPNKKDDQQQYDPTMDGHLNLRCGITMALIEAAEDKNATSLIGGGKPKGDGQQKDSRTGMAKIFRSLEDKEDKTPNVVDTPLERISKKMETYCQIEAHSTSNVNRWKQISDENPGASTDGTTTR